MFLFSLFVQIFFFLLIMTLTESTHSWPKVPTLTHQTIKSKGKAFKYPGIQTLRTRRSDKPICEEIPVTLFDIKRRPIRIPQVKCPMGCETELFPFNVEKLKNGNWVKTTIKVPVSCRLPTKYPKDLISDFNANRIPKVIIKAKCKKNGFEIFDTQLVKEKRVSKRDGNYVAKLVRVPVDCVCSRATGN